MLNGCNSPVLPLIHRAFQEGTVSGLSDSQLLQRFANERDEVAFEAIVARHGQLVLAVCRNLLRDANDVDDAFQATFLVLVRKARSIDVANSLAPWIYAVAHRTAARARANKTRRSRLERQEAMVQALVTPDDPDRHEIRPIVHVEVSRLPERYRAPIVLCYLQGMTHEAAAKQLGCPVGTVRSRLARGRGILGARLARRRLTLSGAIFGAALSLQSASAVVPSRLRRATVKAATRVAAGWAAAGGGLSAPVAALMEGVLRAMSMTRFVKISALALVSTGIVVASFGVHHSHAVAGDGEGTAGAKAGKLGATTSAPVRGQGQETSVVTYYIGDLIVPARRAGVGVETAGPRRVDMTPVIELLTSSVAPGTWKVNDPQGNALVHAKAGTPAVGSITPFFLSISLVVRHTREVHDQVANRLRQLRRLQAIQAGQPEEVDATTQPGQTAFPDTPEHPTRASEPSTSTISAPPKNTRETHLRSLVNELSTEVEALIRERDRLRADMNTAK
jgi:RNA polymerase sigma factor (sigma-70 family)